MSRIGKKPIAIPSGVKMHSAVFATSPEAAGQLVALIATDRRGRLRYRNAEIMDIDEDAVRAGRMSAKLYGYGRMPFETVVERIEYPTYWEERKGHA